MGETGAHAILLHDHAERREVGASYSQRWDAFSLIQTGRH